MKHFFLLLFATSLAAAPRGEDLFQQALMKERSQGDLKGAIEIYQRLSKDKDRKLAARALLEMARCQEKQGGALARQTYERLVREFAEQTDTVAAARARMASMAAPGGTGPRVRRIWEGGDVDDEGSVSPDGRYLSYPHWATGDLGVRDLATNTTKLLTNTGGWERSGGEFAQDSRFSPDGKRIAYGWYIPRKGGQPGGYELRIVNADGSGIRTLAFAGGAHYHVAPICWSRDGRHIATAHYLLDGRKRILFVDAVTGQSRELMTPRTIQISQRGALSPDGRWLALSGEKDQDVLLVPTSGGEPLPVAPHPASDIAIDWKADGKSLYMLSDRSGSHGLWEVPVSDGKQVGAPKLIRGEIGRSLWPVGLLANGSLVYNADLGGVDVHAVALDPKSGRAHGQPVLVSEFLPGHKRRPEVSRDGARVAFVSGGEQSGRATLTVRDLAMAAEQRFAARSPVVYRWHPAERRLLLIEPGERRGTLDMSWLNVDTGGRTRFETLDYGRTIYTVAIHPDGKTVYYARRIGETGAFAIMSMNMDTKEQRVVTETSGEGERRLRGVVVSPDGSLLCFIRSGPSAGAEIVVQPINGGAERVYPAKGLFFGVFSQPAFTADGRALLAVVAKGKDLTGGTEVARIDLASGVSTKTGIEGPLINSLSLDPVGNKLYYQAGNSATEMWIWENIIP